MTVILYFRIYGPIATIPPALIRLMGLWLVPRVHDRLVVMGVESGGGGRVPQSKNQRGTSPRNYTIEVSFFSTHMTILHFTTIQNKQFFHFPTISK